jgi:hypothetical protein
MITVGVNYIILIFKEIKMKYTVIIEGLNVKLLAASALLF